MEERAVYQVMAVRRNEDYTPRDIFMALDSAETANKLETIAEGEAIDFSGVKRMYGGITPSQLITAIAQGVEKNQQLSVKTIKIPTGRNFEVTHGARRIKMTALDMDNPPQDSDLLQRWSVGGTSYSATEYFEEAAKYGGPIPSL